MDAIDIALVVAVVLFVFVDVGIWALIIRERRAARNSPPDAIVETAEGVAWRAIQSGNCVIGNLRDDGRWDVNEISHE